MAVKELALQGIPVISGGQRVDTSAWDSRPQAGTEPSNEVPQHG
jgi:phage terminase Nu1 subunit (DNA packaging protein)